MVFMKNARVCPKGFKRMKGVCTSKQSKTGGREVLLDIDVSLDNSFKDWAYSAKDRLLDHFDREHASDFTDGNVDYHIRMATWKNNVLLGDISLKVPKYYFDDCKDADDFIDVGNAAMDDVIAYNLSSDEQRMIKDYKVKS